MSEVSYNIDGKWFTYLTSDIDAAIKIQKWWRNLDTNSIQGNYNAKDTGDMNDFNDQREEDKLELDFDYEELDGSDESDESDESHESDESDESHESHDSDSDECDNDTKLLNKYIDDCVYDILYVLNPVNIVRYFLSPFFS